uniref:Uncharacterized protein n=1 Tax=Lutzomyia longipalpis TaxID=7200 RepID=A0A1B0CI25_LUTLO
MSVAKAIISHPSIKGTSVTMRVFFLPHLSIRYPLRMHPTGVLADEMLKVHGFHFNSTLLFRRSWTYISLTSFNVMLFNSTLLFRRSWTYISLTSFNNPASGHHEQMKQNIRIIQTMNILLKA